MEMVYLRAVICGELPSGQKRVKILANNADGISFYTDEKSIIRSEDIEKRCNPWIPVKERLPEEHKSVVPGLGTVSKPVLVTWVDPFSKNAYPDNSFVREGITRNGEFTLTHINGDLVPVAWMPQPKPYMPPKEGV